MRLRAWTRKKSLLAIFSGLLMLDLFAGVSSASIAMAAGSVHTTPAAGASSPKTVAWDDGTRNTSDPNYSLFKNLKVTFDQTQNLTDQGLGISWTGGVATPPLDDKGDYLQIMQCWGDPTQGPTPQQCEWGEPSASLQTLVGVNAASRQLLPGEDPAQDYGPGYQVPLAHNEQAWAVPFHSIDGTSAWDPTTYFSRSESNEVTAARTGQDGSGSYDFAVQTSLSAPELGCGAPVTSGGVVSGRSCWLVVVPRGEFNADGTSASSNPDGRVSGSPLSASNWADRIQVKLGFTAIGASCPFGRAERRTAGTELIAGAFTSWQSALCATGTTYGYSEIGDSEARSSLVSGVSGAPELGFVTDPFDTTDAAGATLQYAPVSASGLVIGYNIDKDYTPGSPDYAENGEPVTNLVLTPRLVAKLLTQSYRDDIPGGLRNSTIPNNPASIRNDPEFLALNPDFKYFPPGAAPDGLMVPLGDTDAAAEVWAWLRADPDANDFLSGKADPWGEVVNPAYKSLNLATDSTVDSYPKADLSTFRQDSSVPPPGYGTLDLRPYTLDMNDAASRALVADAGIKDIWDITKVPPALTANGAQIPGSRFELALTDTNSAALDGLQTAKLLNQDGQYVAPTTASITAGINAMVPSATTGVVVTDPEKRADGAYPLTMLTYAVVDVCAADIPSLKDYTKLLTYAVGPGQVVGTDPGELPLGYVPLNPAMVTQTAASVTALQTEIKTPVCESHQPKPPSDTTTGDDGFGDGSASDGGPSATPTPVATAPAHVLLTPAVQTTATRYSILAALFFALPCLAVGPLLLRRRRA